MNNEPHSQTELVDKSASTNPLSPEQRYLRRLERAVHRDYETLLVRVQGLARQLTRLATDLETFGVEWRVASDGAVRGQGLDIDLACARFAAARDALTQFRTEVIDEV